MSERKSIVWFRQDLRLHDNESLTDAVNTSDGLLPIFVFDEREFSQNTRFGFKRTGVHRAKFLIESVHNLRRNLQNHGGDLIVRVGKPEEEVFVLAKTKGVNRVVCNRERTYYEVQIQDKLEENLWSIGLEILYNRGKMLYHTSDFPFPVAQTPDVFTQFRKEVEKLVIIRDPLPVPQGMRFNFDGLNLGEIPTLEALGYTQAEIQSAQNTLVGGEDAALARVEDYFWNHKHALTYKQTRNNMLGDHFSTKFSVWLANGCLSPKYIYKELKSFEDKLGANESTYWIYFELLWRDYFRMIAKKYGSKIFLKSGIMGQPNPQWVDDRALFAKVSSANTGIPVIDANMRELNSTGFMSNRGRQLVASFVVNDLQINWQIGAEYFESMLIDYDPASNYGNWNYIAGVGTDPRGDRYFNVLMQAKRYDAEASFVTHWIPELKKIKNLEMRHCPWRAIHEKDFRLERDYCEPMILADCWSY
jgi:deoxyribodipyrimidine photo-lyase